MKKYKTENLEAYIAISKVDDTLLVEVEMNDDPVNSFNTGHKHHIKLPASVCKNNFNDSNFLKHIMNFFIKD